MEVGIVIMKERVSFWTKLELGILFHFLLAIAGIYRNV